MSNEEFRTQVEAVRDKIQELPETLQLRLTKLLDDIVQAHDRRRRLINEAVEALSELRLQVKYLVFDLEATRRENGNLKRQLGQA